ncbi:hypothetical protein R6Q59_018957 [Mikania micrantha]
MNSNRAGTSDHTTDIEGDVTRGGRSVTFGRHAISSNQMGAGDPTADIEGEVTHGKIHQILYDDDEEDYDHKDDDDIRLDQRESSFAKARSDTSRKPRITRVGQSCCWSGKIGPRGGPKAAMITIKWDKPNAITGSKGFAITAIGEIDFMPSSSRGDGAMEVRRTRAGRRLECVKKFSVYFGYAVQEAGCRERERKQGRGLFWLAIAKGEA